MASVPQFTWEVHSLAELTIDVRLNVAEVIHTERAESRDILNGLRQGYAARAARNRLIFRANLTVLH